MRLNREKTTQTDKGFLKSITTKKALLLIFALGVLVYFNSLFNGFIGDDYAQVVNNPIVHDLGNIGKFFSNSTFYNGVQLTGTYYKPILTTSYSLIYSLFQTSTFPYHFVQLLIHIINSILLFLIFKNILGKEITLAIALIFLVHPINNESVVSIAALQEPLFLFYGLLSLWVIQIVPDGLKRNVLIVTLLLLSLLSKETGILFLVILPLFSKFFKDKWQPALSESGIALVIYLVMRMGVAQVYFFQNEIFKYPLAELSLLQRALNIPAILFFYIKTFFYPKDLLVLQRWVITATDFTGFYLPLVVDLVFMILLGLGFYWIYKKHSENLRIYLFFLLWFILGISLHLQIIPLDYTVADRWFYFPLIGLLGMIGTLIASIRVNNKLNSAMLLLILLLISIYSVRDIVRNSNWSNAFTLYEHDIKKQPDNYGLHSGLGIELYNQKRFDEAKKHLLYSIELYPTNQNWSALAFVYEKSNDIPNAKKAFLAALTYNDYPATYQSLVKLMTVHDTPESTSLFIKEKLENHPEDPLLWLYLSVANYQLGKKDEALLEVQKSYDIYPSQESMYVYQRIINDEPINLINNK